MQFIHNVNRDRSISAKIIKGDITQHHIDIYKQSNDYGGKYNSVIFAVFDPSPLILWINCL